MPSDTKLTDKVEVQCKTLLTSISDSLLALSSETHRPVHALAEELQKIRPVAFGDTCRQQLLAAISTHHCAVSIAGAATLNKLVTSQQTLSQDMENVRDGLSTIQDQIQQLNVTTDSVLQSVNEQASRSEQMVGEFTTCRTLQPIASIVTDERPSAGPNPDLGTMSEYLREIWRTGSATTDQDIWECYYDIISVYTKFEVPVALRFNAGSWEKDLWDHLGCYKRIPFIEGTRRFRWEYVIPLDSSKWMCGHVEEALDLYNLRLILMFLVSGREDNESIHGHPQTISEEDNPSVANVHYRMHSGGMVSALERINCLIRVSREAQDNTILFGDVVGVNDIPYFRDFLSMLPNPSRVSEVPNAFWEVPAETLSSQSDTSHSGRRIHAGWTLAWKSNSPAWTNNLVDPWEIDWSEWGMRSNEFFLKSVAQSRKRETIPKSEFDECHSLCDGCSADSCHLCDERRVDEIPDDILQEWNENFDRGRMMGLELLEKHEGKEAVDNP